MLVTDLKGMVKTLEMELDETPSIQVAVGFHADMDGVVGAVCIKTWLKSIISETRATIEANGFNGLHFSEDLVSYIPLQYGQNMTQNIGALGGKKLIIFIDFCPTVDELKEMISNGSKVFVFDHHKTQKDKYVSANVDGKLEEVRYYYDASKAGCGIALEAFIGEGEWCYESFYNILKFSSDYAEDRDLWKFELPNSKEINVGLFSIFKLMEIEKNPEKIFDLFMGKVIEESQLLIDRYKELKLPKNWNNFFGSFTNTLIEIGLSKLGYDGDFVNQIFGSAKRGKIPLITINGCKMFVLNNSTLISEVGNKLTELDYPSCQYFIVSEPLKEPQLVLSFRSTDDLPDVSMVAKALGGGGHRNACGVTLKVSQLEDLLAGRL